MKDLITVVINVYNDEVHISKCIDSIINQTYKNLEIIIVNDGSKDNTLSICEGYKDKRIKIITHPNMGLSRSRNVGIDNAHGKYIYFMDSDDFIELDTIEYLYKINKKNKTKIATCEVLDIYDYDFKVDNKPEEVNVLNDLDMVKKILLNIGRNGTIWNKLFDIKLFNKIRFEERIANDVVVMYKLYFEAKKITFSNQIKHYYFRHKDSILGKRGFDMSVDMLKGAYERYDYIDKLYPNLIENDICLLMMILDAYYHADKRLEKYLKDNHDLKRFNKLFSFKVLRYKFRFNNKIKLLLFKISPRLFKSIAHLYIKITK